MICYEHNNKKLFDIQHIITIIGSKESYRKAKYNKFSDKVINYFWHKNKYNGYMLRELISINTVKQMIYKSNKRGSNILAKMLNIKIIDIKIPSKENCYVQNILTVFKHERFSEHHNVGRYFIDLYFPDYLLAIECDEHNHKDRDLNYERERQEYIENKLNCTFIRFDPYDLFFDIFAVISKIHYHVSFKKHVR